jgi:hypothetical protein
MDQEGAVLQSSRKSNLIEYQNIFLDGNSQFLVCTSLFSVLSDNGPARNMLEILPRMSQPSGVGDMVDKEAPQWSNPIIGVSDVYSMNFHS